MNRISGISNDDLKNKVTRYFRQSSTQITFRSKGKTTETCVSTCDEFRKLEFLRLCMCLGEVCLDGLKNTEKSIYANGVRLFPSGKRLSSFVRSFVRSCIQREGLIPLKHCSRQPPLHSHGRAISNVNAGQLVSVFVKQTKVGTGTR